MTPHTKPRMICSISVLAVLSVSALLIFGCLTGWDFDTSDSEPILIVTGSMDGEPVSDYDIPSIPKDSLVILEYLPRGELARIRTGDVLAYDWDDRIVVHRVKDINRSDRTFVLKGDANDSSETVSFDDVVGQVIGVYPHAGKVLVNLRDTPFLSLLGILVGALAVGSVRDILRIIRDEGD